MSVTDTCTCLVVPPAASGDAAVAGGHAGTLPRRPSRPPGTSPPNSVTPIPASSLSPADQEARAI